MKLLMLVLLPLAILAQNQRVEIAQPAEATQIYRDGSGNKEYVCTANSNNKETFWTRGGTGTSLTSIVVAANVGTITFGEAHGLRVGNRIYVQQATVDTDLIGTYKVLTVPSTTTVTIATGGVTDATYTEPPLRVHFKGPRLTDTVWAVQRLFYTGTELDAVQHAVDDTANGRTAGSKSFVCTSSAVLAGLTYN